MSEDLNQIYYGRSVDMNLKWKKKGYGLYLCFQG